MFFYKNPYTRVLVPRVWKEASKEKLKHADDLREIQKFWKLVDKPIVHIQGTRDSIVPYRGTVNYLRSNINLDFYTHIPVPKKGHGFVYTEK